MLTETVTWRPAASGSMPDSDSTVLVAIDVNTPHSEPVWLGYHDGDCWRDIEGQPITVTHWAEMLHGPAAAEAS